MSGEFISEKTVHVHVEVQVQVLTRFFDVIREFRDRN